MGPASTDRVTILAARPDDRASTRAMLRLDLPATVRRHGTALLNQQFWLWGQDIRRPDGNLLLAYGFERERPPAGHRGSPTYTLELGRGRMIQLWGFGLRCADATGCVYVSRFGLAPLLIDAADPPAGIWHPAHLPTRRSPRGEAEWAIAWPLLGDAVRFLAAYERWVQTTHGLPERQAVLRGWEHPVCPIERMPVVWTRLARQLGSTGRRALIRLAAGEDVRRGSTA